MFKISQIEIFSSQILTEIKGVKEYHKEGYIVLEMNYGEEFYSLSEIIEDLGLSYSIDILKELSIIDRFEVRR